MISEGSLKPIKKGVAHSLHHPEAQHDPVTPSPSTSPAHARHVMRRREVCPLRADRWVEEVDRMQGIREHASEDHGPLVSAAGTVSGPMALGSLSLRQAGTAGLRL